MLSRSTVSLMAAAASLFVSCARQPVAVQPAQIDATAAADRLLEAHDTDGNGSLSAEEASACQGLAQHFDRYDTDANGAVSPAEISARIEKWKAAGVGVMRVGCRVTLNDRPLANANVLLEPYPLLGESLQRARGTTNAYGQCSLSVAAEDLPPELQRVRGVQPGLYLVRITHPETSVPAKYNTQTTLGLEVASDTISPAGVELPLTSR